MSTSEKHDLRGRTDINVKEAAVLLGLAETTTRELAGEGRIGRKRSGRWQFSYEELIEFKSLRRPHGRPPSVREVTVEHIIEEPLYDQPLTVMLSIEQMRFLEMVSVDMYESPENYIRTLIDTHRVLDEG